MKTVLVLGGYGGFGARLARRLADDGWTVLVAGRNLAKAEHHASQLPGATAVQADRNGDLASVLASHRPFLLIDAAGPFQGSGYQVAEACIAAGVHYVDLADAKAFVCGIGVLDGAAKAAGVVVISGASSVPALSGAVLKRLTADMTSVASIDMALSASNRAAAGASVSAAILSYVGKPVSLWRGRHWITKTGWHEIRCPTYRVAGHRPIRRLVALSDVPDHTILPETLPGRPATTFRAGPEFGFQLMVLWLLSWPVRWGLIASLASFARLLLPLQKLTARLGSDRSAFMIEAKGMTATGPETRCWTLIAENGDGPEIPTLAAPPVARAIVEGRMAAGARSAENLLSLEDFAPAFDTMAIATEWRSEPYMPLYKRVMGAAYDALPQAVRSMHAVTGDAGASGEAEVMRGRSLPARLVCAVMGFPPSGWHSLHVGFSEQNGVERWERDFSGQCFASELSQQGGTLIERFGPMRFTFALDGNSEGLEMRFLRWSFLGLPMPRLLAPRVTAREWADGDAFHFDIAIAVPLAGDVVRYRGWLRPAPSPPSSRPPSRDPARSSP